MKNTTIAKTLNSGKSSGKWQLGYLLLIALMSVTTAFSQTGTIGIGTGTSTNGLIPINSCYNYSYSQQIIKASEYAAGNGVAGQITKVRWYYASGGTTMGNWNNWTVYLGHTAKTEFTSTSDWEPVANLTQVYSGAITPVAGNWFEITLTTPFNYNGTSNLILAVDENLPGFSCTANFGSYASTSNSGIYYYSDGTNPDPASPPAGTRTATVARVQFEGPVAACVSPTGIAAVPSVTTANLSWTASTSAPANGYQYYVSTTNTAPGGATVPTGSVAAGTTTAALTGLAANTQYYVWVRSACDASTNSSWSTVASFTTQCSSTDVPYMVDANSVTTPAMPSCITTQNAGSGNNWTTTGNPGYGFSSNVFRYNYNSSNAANAWFYTQGINLTAGTSYRVSYLYGNNSTFYVEKLKVAYGTSASATAMTNVLADYPSVTGAAAQEAVIDFVPTTTGVYYFGFQAYSAADQFSLYVDDISVNLTPTCEPVDNVVAQTVSFTSGSISWDASSSDPANGYEYYVSDVNTAPDGATVATGSVAAGVLEADLTGLTSGTTYYVWVRAACSVSDKSPWEGPSSFFTGYCTPAPSSMDGDGIVGVAVGTINNVTGAETGYYGDYSAMVTDVDVASTVDVAITYNTGYTYGTKIWVDWNNDTDFDDEGELVYTGLSTNDEPTTLEASFVVPADAALVGAHRMRIGGTDNNSGPSSPCYTGSWGSFEDYTLNVVVPGPPVIAGFTPDAYCAVEGVITITGTELGNATLTIGGTAVDIDTNTATEITATVAAGVSGTVSVTTFGGTDTTVDSFTVTTPATLALSAADTTICAGDVSETITVTEGLADFDTYVWAPMTGVMGDATGGFTFNPAETTTYTLTASQSAGSCEISVEFTVNVNDVPNPVSIEPSSATVCQGSVIVLTGQGGETIVPQTYCSPTVGNTGASGDYINNFTFANITNNASGDAASDYTYYSALTANVVGGQTYNVSIQGGSATWAQTFRIWIDFNQDGVFSADESVFNTSTASTAVQSGTITIPATAFNGMTRMRVGDKFSTAITATEACGHTGFGEWEDYNVMITGAASAVEYVWAPVDGLYTDAAATVAYTGEPATMVYAMPLADMTYTATVTTDLGCSAVGTSVLTVNIVPAPTGDANQAFETAAMVSDLTATGTAIQWYNVATGGTALAADAQLTSGMYYATQTIDGCESMERLAVTVTIPQMDWVNLQWPPQLTIVQGATGNVYAQAWEPGVTPGAGPGIGVQAWIGVSSEDTDPSTWTTWIPMTYNTQVGNNDEFVAAIGTGLEPGTYYYASRFQLMAGPYSYGGYSAGGGSFWDGQQFVSGVLTVNCGTAAPSASAAQSVCYSGTIADLMAEGEGIQWYATPTGGTALASDAALVNGATYYASQTTTCESITRTAVAVTINSTLAPTGAAAQTFESGATVADLMATGTDIMWYDAATGGAMLDADTELVDGATYYATQTVNGCESIEMLAVTVTVNMPMMDWINLQYPGSATITQGGSVTVYAQGYEAGVTQGTGPGAGVMAWVGISMEDTDPATWTEWVPATYSGQSGNNDEFMATIGASLAPGTYYYASRFQLMDGPYSYGGYSAQGGGAWDGVAAVNGILIVECAAMAPEANPMQYICVSGTVADLQAVGSDVMWYADMEGGEALAPETDLVDGMTYYASQMVGGCESIMRTAVMVDVSTIAAPTGEASQVVEYFGDIPTVEDIMVEGENVVWYPTMEDAMAGTNAFEPGSVIEAGMTYYAMQTVNGCTSVEALAVTVTETLGGDRFDATTFSAYPNPVKDVLTIEYSSDITSVSVFNMLGQQVLAATPNATVAKLDMAVLSDGTYLVNVTVGNTVKTIKVVKKQ